MSKQINKNIFISKRGSQLPFSERRDPILGYLFLLTLFFIFIEISLFFQNSQGYVGNFKIVANYLVIPKKSWLDILNFTFIQIALHILFTLAVWVMARLMGFALNCQWHTVEKIAFTLWGLCLGAVLLANQAYYPASKFAKLTQIFFPSFAVKFLLIFVESLIVIAILFSLFGCVRWLTRKNRKVHIAAIVLSVFFAILFLHNKFSFSSPRVQDAATPQTPNIIVIGLDALRPDFLGFFGAKKQTPHIDTFLNESTVFANTMTPIARTFPAWVSILTGEYPKITGVRFNLARLNHFNQKTSLPFLLQKKGYETIFSTDETRFSNVDERFGFDKIITPPIGLNDFLLGSLNDFPLANLLVNTFVGRFLFPYSYGNRPAFVTYDPNSYLNLVESALEKPRTKPLFLVVHFCLTHYPYVLDHHNDPIHNYEAAVRRIDQQFADFMQLLKKYNLLQQSIIVLLSDHGEALALEGDRATDPDLFVTSTKNKNIPHFYPVSDSIEKVNQSVGHGTDILSLTQYHSLLAFKLEGAHKNQPTTLGGLVSLLDIKPTLLALLGLSSINNAGKNLQPYLLGKLDTITSQHDFFLETDFSPPAILSINPNPNKLLLEGINFYSINEEDARITVKPEMAKVIISGKQYAIIRGDWMLALYPQPNEKMTPILLNLRSGLWTNDLTLPFAKLSPAASMLSALKNFYTNDIHPLTKII